MRTPLRMIALAALLVASARQASPEVPLTDFMEVLGKVTNAARPLENVLIVALNLSNFTAIEAVSGREGEFRLPPLQTAVYRVIAIKHGFAPSAVTLLPTNRQHRLALKLQNDSDGSKTMADEIWALRSSLPTDVLRELEIPYGPSPESDAARKFQGEMRSLTAMTADSSPSLAQTAVGMRSDIGNGWKVDFKGNLDRIDDAVRQEGTTNPAAESSGMVMEIHSSPANSYRFASTRSSWRYRDADSAADLQNQNFEWRHEDSKVEIHYLSQENLFRSPYGSDLVEVAGESHFYETGRSELGVGVRLAQENVGHDPTLGAVSYRRADLATTGRFDPSRDLSLRYGLRTRLDENGTVLAPETGAVLKVGPTSHILVTGMYKVMQDGVTTAAPSRLMVWNDGEGAVTQRYAYSVGFSAGSQEAALFKAVASVSAADSGVRLVFDDRLQQAWDVLDLAPGDVRRDLTVSFHRAIGKGLALELMTSAGSAHSAGGAAAPDRYYVTGELQSVYVPSGTSVDVSYRQIGQHADLGASGPGLLTRRMKVQMGQSLHLPMDVRVLLGLELARGALTPFAGGTEDGSQYRYLGGLGFAF
jgi:hypothetical protein